MRERGQEDAHRAGERVAREESQHQASRCARIAAVQDANGSVPAAPGHTHLHPIPHGADPSAELPQDARGALDVFARK